MDYGKLRSPWKRLVCCPSQCQIQTGEENASLSRSRLPVDANRRERGQREEASLGGAQGKREEREMVVGTIFPPDLEFSGTATLPSSLNINLLHQLTSVQMTFDLSDS